MATKEVNIVIKATDKATKTFSKVGKASVAFASAIGVMAINAAVKFEKQMASVSTLLDGDVDKSIKNLTYGIEDLLRTMPVTADELGIAAYDAVSAGFGETADTLLVLDAASRLAVGGLGTVKEATLLTTGALNSFGMSAEDADEAADILFKTVKKGTTTVSELTQSFGNVAPIAVDTGVSLKELSAATAAVTTTTMKASAVQNSLRQLFLEMTSDTTKLAGAFEQMGVSNVKAAVEAEGFVPLLERMKVELGLTDNEFKNLISSAEAKTVAMGLLGSQSDEYIETMASMQDGTNALTDAVDKQSESSAAQYQMLKNNLNVELTHLGNTILPALVNGMGLVNTAINETTGLFSEWKGVISDAGQDTSRYMTIVSNLKIAVDKSTGAEKDYLKAVLATAEVGLKKQKQMADGHIIMATNMMDIESDMKKSIKDLSKQWGVDSKKMGKSMEGLSLDTIAYLSEIDGEFSQEVLLSGVRAKEMTENYAEGISEGLPSVEGAVENVIATIDNIDDTDSAIWGVHMLGNLAQGMRDNLPAVSSAVDATMSIIRRLQHSTNEELPEELWGQHASENFGVGWMVGNQKVKYAVGETVSILNAFGQEVDIVVGDVSGYWDAYTTKLDDTNKSQKELFSDGITGIAEMQKEYESEVAKIKNTISGLQEDLSSIFGEASEKEAENRNKLANAIVGSEEKMADIKAQIQEESDWVKRDQLQRAFEEEQVVRDENKALIEQMEVEVTEIKRYNNLTRLGQAVETYHKEQEALKIWKDDAIASWQEQYNEAETSLKGIQELWGIRTEALKEYMGEEIGKNGELKSAVESSIDEVKELINQLKELDRQQSSMGMSSGGGSVPRMAKGGIVNSPTLALIGEDGPEAVVPLNKKNNPMYGEGGGTIINITGTFLSEDIAEELGDTIVRKLALSTRF